MGIRRRARETALQFLFQEDMAAAAGLVSGDTLSDRFERFCALYEVARKAHPYALEVIQGVMDNQVRIDGLISASGSHWRVERLTMVDRNLLRVAVYEMAVRNDVPAQVAINEAIEIARRFGTEESPAFVNGVLDAVKAALPLPRTS